MRTQLSVGQPPCLTIPGKQALGRQRQDEGMNTARRFPDIPYDLVRKVCFVNSTGRRVQ